MNSGLRVFLAEILSFNHTGLNQEEHQEKKITIFFPKKIFVSVRVLNKGSVGIYMCFALGGDKYGIIKLSLK